jgi:hypothetical protein
MKAMQENGSVVKTVACSFWWNVKQKMNNRTQLAFCNHTYMFLLY